MPTITSYTTRRDLTVATAPTGQRNRQLWESARNLYNLVATGTLDHQQVHQSLLQAAERCGLLAEEPRQTQRTLASGRQVGLAGPRPAPARTHPDHPAGRSSWMGSSQSLDQASPSWDLDAIITHPALQQRTADALLATTRDLEQAFDRLNPKFGVPADTHNPYGHHALHDREAALALGTRVAVASSRENDPNPVMWLAGQDYRAADAIRTARLETIRHRHGPERLGPER